MFTNTNNKNFPILLLFVLDEPLRMIWSISLIELTSGYGVNVNSKSIVEEKENNTQKRLWIPNKAREGKIHVY